MFKKLVKLAVSAAATTNAPLLPQLGLNTHDVNAGVNVAGMIAGSPSSPTFDLEWIGDAGAGRNLSSLKHLPDDARQFLGESKHAVNFSTGGGAKGGDKIVGLNAGLAKGDELFILKDCPNALSTGIQVQKHRRPFIWVPDEVPYFIKSEMWKDCVIKVPDEAKLKADRVEDNVPIFKDKVKVTFATPAPLQGGEGAPKVDGSDELACAEAAPQAADDDDFGGLPPPEPDEDEISISHNERLKAEATSKEHMVSHFPKNPFCEACKIAKMTSARIDHKGKQDVTKGLPLIERLGQLIMADTIILASSNKSTGY
jgi:hypothetical protein